MPHASRICKNLKNSSIVKNTLSTNFNELPFLIFLLSLVDLISQHKVRIVEGELRCRELSEYLSILKLKPYIWLSEDGSGIISKVEYDPKSNQLIGLVLPTNAQSGMPINFSFMAKSVSDIQKFMKMTTSSLVYVVMAQPLMENVPPFVLQIFGVDNKFTVAGFSSDGDPRLLSSMRANTKFPNHENSNFSCTLISDKIMCFVQDS